MPDETFEVAFETTGSDETVDELNKVKQAQDQIAQNNAAQAGAAQRSGAAVVRSAKSQSAAIGTLGGRVGQTASAVGNLGTVIGQVNPQLGRMGSLAGSIGSAFSAASGAMGPWGIALAGISATIAVVGSAMDSAAEDAAKLSERLERQSQSVRTLNSNYETLVRRIGEARRRFNELFGIGVESTQQAGQAVQETADRIEATERQIENLRRSISRLEAGDPILTRDALQAQRRLLAMAEDRLSILEFQRDATRNLVADTEAQITAEREQQEAERDAERAAEEARARAQQAYREMMAERARLDAASNDASEAFHQRSLERIAELAEELERTGDILDPTARAAADARTALEGTFSVLAREDAEKARASASQRADTRRGLVRTGGDMGADLAEFRAFVNAQGDMDAERTQRYQDALHAREDAHRAHILAIRDLEASGTDWTEEQFNRRVALHEEMLAMQRADEAATVERTKELAAITDGMWESIGGTVTDAAGSMFKFLISGAEGGSDAFLAMLDSFLEATAVEYTIKALGEAANAVAAAARQDYAAAAQHGVAAGMAAAVAAATGLASAAISVPSTGAGAGAPPQVGAGAQSGGTTNITIQLYAPQAVFTEAERGELIARGVREAERVRPGSARF